MYIFHEELNMEKYCARRMSLLLTVDQKRTGMKISEQCLERFNKNKTDFVHGFITIDGTWTHHYTRIQTAAKTVDTSRLFSAKEDKVGSISRKGHGIGVLGC
jgi:hypothetical protein